jgi:hypothetical protein
LKKVPTGWICPVWVSVLSIKMAVEQAGAYSHFYGEEPEKT